MFRRINSTKFNISIYNLSSLDTTYSFTYFQKLNEAAPIWLNSIHVPLCLRWFERTVAVEDSVVRNKMATIFEVKRLKIRSI